MRAPTDHETALFDALVQVARPVILSEFNPDSCIVSTRIGLDVLDYFGTTAKELPLMTVVFNAEAVDLLHNGTSMEELRDLLRPIPADRPGGPWSMGVGAPGGTGWAGHLVITVPEVGVVIDLSLDQASRPHKGIALRPYWCRIEDPDWWDGTVPAAPASPAAVVEPAHTGTGAPAGSVESEAQTLVLLDRRTPDPTGYRTSPNWQRRTSKDTAVVRRMSGQIIREVRARLD